MRIEIVVEREAEDREDYLVLVNGQPATRMHPQYSRRRPTELSHWEDDAGRIFLSPDPREAAISFVKTLVLFARPDDVEVKE